jgi:hypothetical protein
MSSVSSSFASPSRRQYVASGLFDTNIFQYSTYTDSQLNTRGRLIIHPSAVAGVNCLPNTILRENGKKLHTGTHPDLVDPTTNLPYTYLVGVYDVISGINGFINPNAPYFAVLNTDKSYQDDLTKEQVDASRNTLTAASGVYPYNNTSNQILGPPVNTAGDVLSGGYLEGKQVHAADLVHTPGFIVSGPDALISTPVTGVPIVYGAGTILANSNITSLANIYASNGVVHGSNVTAMSNVTAGNIVFSRNGVVSSNGQIRVNNLQVYSTSTQSSTVTIDVSLAQVHQINFSGTMSIAGIDASNILAGAVVYVICNNTSTNQINITLGNNIREATGSPNGNYSGAGTAYNTINFIVPSGVAGTITFVSNGTSLFEVARVLNNSN